MSVRNKRDDKIRDSKVTDHAWKGTWNRPVKVDEESFDPLTVARMTDHNVRGADEARPPETAEGSTAGRPEGRPEVPADEGGKVSPEEAIRIQSKDLPSRSPGPSIEAVRENRTHRRPAGIPKERRRRTRGR